MPVEMKEVTSSQIHSCGYCHDTGTMHVRFKNKSGLGKLYTYPVTPDMHNEFMAADSKGTFFGQKIRGAKDEDGNLLYPHTLVDEKKDDEA